MGLKLEELVGKRLTEEQFDEAAGKKDACYHKVKARYDVWPSAYASGALVKCRKVGAKNWGNKSKKEGIEEKMRPAIKKALAQKGYGPIFNAIETSKRQLKQLRYSRGEIQDTLIDMFGDEDPKILKKIKESVKLNEAKYTHKYPSITAMAKDYKRIFPSTGPAGGVKISAGSKREATGKRSQPAFITIEGDKKLIDAYKKIAFNGSGKYTDVMKSLDEGLNERAWTPDQTKAVDKVDNEFNKLMAKKGIEPYSVEAARLWKSAGFDKKMGKIFGKNESVNEQSKVIKSIDNLAKKNKYGTVTGTQMNGKTANTIMKIYNHPKMKKHKKALDNFTSDELVNLTMTLPKTLGIKEDISEGLDDLKNIPPDLRKTMKKKRLEGNNQLDSRTGNLDRLIRIVKSKKQDSQTEKQLKDLMKMRNKKESVDEARGTCWVGYQQVGMKNKGGRMVPNCVKEITEIYYEENGKGYGYTFEHIKENDLNEAEYQGRKVKLGKIMQGDTKKFKVYVKNPKGNVVKVNFGQGGSSASKTGGTMRIRKSNPKARANFRARHNCDNPGPRHKARYWSCRKW